ncbi:ABC transporter permease [Candidatus Woesearchaeota archaeon]|nr:ABC transporter permease [Candidatus Woesearchaeota archaeon]
MKLVKCLRHALTMVLHSRLRSWLTIIGIVIGVASVIAIVSLGAGMEAAVNSQISGLGADLVTVSPGYSRAMRFGPGGDFDGGSSASDATLGRQDLQVVRGLPEVKAIGTQIRGSVEVYYLGEKATISLTGVDQSTWKDITTDGIGEGRMLGPADSNVVVIGERLATEHFDKPIGINQLLTIEGRSFRVVGILEEGTGSTIHMPISQAYQVLEDSVRGEYDSIIIKVKDGVDVQAFVDKLEKRLMLSRHVTSKDQDFSVSSNIQFASRMSDMTSTMTMFLAGIAAISLLVGAVGIANTMFTSVLEKTKEIGIMKAIGARNRDIMLIFLFNAGSIGLVGGFLGIGLGWIISKGLGAAMEMSTIVSGGIVAIALLVSVGVGIIAGIVPAYQASQLSPVDALRYE